jgi:hypothetical protein
MRAVALVVARREVRLRIEVLAAEPVDEVARADQLVVAVRDREAVAGLARAVPHLRRLVGLADERVAAIGEARMPGLDAGVDHPDDHARARAVAADGSAELVPQPGGLVGQAQIGRAVAVEPPEAGVRIGLRLRRLQQLVLPHASDARVLLDLLGLRVGQLRREAGYREAVRVHHVRCGPGKAVQHRLLAGSQVGAIVEPRRRVRLELVVRHPGTRGGDALRAARVGSKRLVRELDEIGVRSGGRGNGGQRETDRRDGDGRADEAPGAGAARIGHEPP